jgi:hypothetical protein
MSDGRRSGCLAIGVAFVALLVLLGAVSVSVLLGLWSDEPELGASAPPTGGPSPTGPAPTGCADDTAAFRAFADPDVRANARVLDSVTLVCWQPSGELRVEARYPADVNAESASMTWLCGTLSGFVADTGRTPRGFTVYSVHPATPGRPFLVAGAQDRTCTNPQHRR